MKTLLMNKRINAELFIYERAALYIQKGANKNKDRREKGKIMGAREVRGNEKQ